MANIREKLTLVDAFSAVYNRFIKQSAGATRGAEKVSKSVNDAEKAAKSAQKAADQMGRQFEDAFSKSQKMPKMPSAPKIPTAQPESAKPATGNTAAGSLLDTAKQAAVAIGGIKAAQGILGLADSISQTNARLQLMNDGLQTTSELNDMIFQAAQRARAPYQDMADSIAKMGLNAGNAFDSNQELIQFMENVSKQFAIGGASATDTKYSMVQLTQAMASGALRGEELNSILDAAPGIARNIEKSMGWASGSIKQYAEQGLVTAEVVKNAMLQSTDEINRQFKAMPMTFSQAVTMLQNQARQAFAPVGAIISETINSDAFVSGLDALGKTLYAGMTLAAQGARVASGAVKLVGDNLSWIIPIVGAAVAAFALYKTAMLIGAAISGAQALVNGILAAQTMLAAGATVAATAAQYGYNAALLACPITWIVIALVALIAMVFAAANAFNQMAGIANTALGVIVGTVYGAAAVIGNVFAMIANLAISAAEWIVNTFNTAVYNVELFFYNLAVGAAEKFNAVSQGAANAAQAIANVFVDGANAAIGAINTIIDAINKIPGQNIGKVGTIGSVSISAPTIDTSGIKAPTAPQKVSFGRFDTTSMGDAWTKGFTKGAAKGDSAMNKLTKGFDSIKKSMDAVSDYQKLMKGANSGSGAGAGGTGGSGGSGGGGKGKKGNVGSVDKVKSVGGDISLADEDVKIFRDLAERKYINNIQLKTSAPNINMSVTNNKGKDIDGKGVVALLLSALSEESNARTAKSHG